MISGFFGKYRFLSNFYPAEVYFDGNTYPTVEHAYQAAKTLDDSAREKIRNCQTPGQAKRMGKYVRIRNDWEQIKLSIMLELIRQKFTHSHSDLLHRLVETGDQELVEENTWGDTFWGVYRGKGENNLGKILMKVRDELR